jgi:hypothetical protein
MPSATSEIRFLTKKAKAGWCSYYRLLDEARKTVELLEKIKEDVPLKYLIELQNQIHGLRRYDREYQKRKEEEEKAGRENIKPTMKPTKKPIKEQKQDEVPVAEGSIVCSPIPEEKKKEVIIIEATAIPVEPTIIARPIPEEKKKEVIIKEATDISARPIPEKTRCTKRYRCVTTLFMNIVATIFIYFILKPLEKGEIKEIKSI